MYTEEIVNLYFNMYTEETESSHKYVHYEEIVNLYFNMYTEETVNPHINMYTMKKQSILA